MLLRAASDRSRGCVLVPAGPKTPTEISRCSPELLTPAPCPTVGILTMFQIFTARVVPGAADVAAKIRSDSEQLQDHSAKLCHPCSLRRYGGRPGDIFVSD